MNFFRNQYERWKIRRWLKLHGIDNYLINDDFTVDVYEDVSIGNHRYELNGKLPVKFGKVHGHFFVCAHQLTTLENCPYLVKGDFWCDGNLLTSLAHHPTSISGQFHFYKNPLLTDYGLSLLMIENVQSVHGPEYSGSPSFVNMLLHRVTRRPSNVVDILNRHLQGDRDIFACQQELIEAGLERHATL